MASGHSSSSSSAPQAVVPQQSSASTAAQPSATRRDLTSWWKRFNMKLRKDEERAAAAAAASSSTATEADAQGQGYGEAKGHGAEPRMIFGVPLQESIRYANVAISLTDANGKSSIYGYVPIVVAKCGVFLKEKATEIEGIFRLSGSSKRIKDLQMIFNSPDRYGKGLDWTGFTVHDAANILRRYLNQLPEPIIPLHSYERFRDPLRHYVPPPAREGEAHEQEGENAVEAEIIKVYQQAITELPPLNRQLLLYILDLLAVFASKSDINRMTSANLAAIFQPGMLSHPSHDMKPDEYRLSQDVLVFLIENQDHFLIGMRGTAADEETVRDVQSGATTAAPASATTVPTMSKNNMARSSSNASAGAESVRRYGGLRRNVSVSSSKQSKRSSHAASPVSPGQMSAVGVHRSSTLPSKKSPGLSSNRFPTRSYSPTRTSAGPLPTSATTTPSSRGPSSPGLAVNVSPRPDGGRTGDLAARDGGGSSGGADLGAVQGDRAPVAPVTGLASDGDSRESLLLEVLTPSPTPMAAVRSSSPSVTPAKERNFSSLFSRSPTSDSERRESRPGKKLRKKRIPGAINGSPHSSTHSLEEK